MLSRQSFVTLAFALMLALLLIDWYSVDNGMAFQQSDVGKQVTVASSKPPSSITVQKSGETIVLRPDGPVEGFAQSVGPELTVTRVTNVHVTLRQLSAQSSEMVFLNPMGPSRPACPPSSTQCAALLIGMIGVAKALEG